MDFYRQRLKQAAWDWMEGHPRRKDRRDGRAEKRSARQKEVADIDDQQRSALHPAEEACLESCCAVWIDGVGYVSRQELAPDARLERALVS